jgi:hypothetical protein
MERTDIIKRVYDLKCEVLKEIRKVLPNGIHQFVQPFYIHYIEGEVATTEVCRMVEVSADECQMVKIHHQSEGYGPEDIDVTDGEELMQYDTQSFADILGNLKAEIRGKKLSVLRNLIEQNGGKMQFDGSFTFIGMQEMANGTTSYFDDTKLFGMEIVDGKLSIDDMWDGDSFQNDEDFIDFDELDRIIEYVKYQIEQLPPTAKKKSVMYCPYCGSSNIEYMGDSFGDYEDGTDAYHCHECDSWFGVK